MKKDMLKKKLVLPVILLFFMFTIEPIIGSNAKSTHEESYLPDFTKGCLTTEDDLFDDILVTNSVDNGQFSVLLGNGSGGFFMYKSYSIGGEHPADLVSADFNKDDFLDLAIPYNIFAGIHRLVVYLGKGGGLFGDPTNYTLKSNSHGITSGDFNNDDNVDLGILCRDSYGVSFLQVFLGYSDGTFTKKQTLALPEKSAKRLVSGDFNNDSFQDLAIICDNAGDGHLTIVLGNGTGLFYFDQGYRTGDVYHSVEIITNDFNFDGFLDLAVTNNGDNDVSVFYNDGIGNFSNRKDFYTTGNSHPKSLISEDFNMDGFLDLAVTITERVCILLGNETGEFGGPVNYDVGASYQGNDIVAHDFNRDGFFDLVVSNGNDDTVTFLKGYGDGTFGDRQDFSAGNHPYGIVVGNFNPAFIPNLYCDGDLSWSEVESGSIVIGNFSIENIGHLKSHLNWEIESFPEWGNWTFTPSNGFNLTPDDGVFFVNVSVVAPDEKNSEFNGEVKIVNEDDASDFCIIDVSLATPKNKAANFNFTRINWLFEHFPLLTRLIQFIRYN